MTYYVTDDEERWTVAAEFATRVEAIAAGPAEFDLNPGQRFWTGAEGGVVDTFGPYADRIIEDAQERAFDDNECAETWLDGVTAEQRDELDKALEQVWEAWLDKHGLRPKWFTVDDIVGHVYDGSDLHVYTNGTDWVVARSVEDAWVVWCASNGESAEDYEDEWTWELEPDDDTLTVRGEGDEPSQTKTCAEWAKGGRGFICSTEV